MSSESRADVCGKLHDQRVPGGVIYAYLTLGMLITSKNRDVMTRDHKWIVDQFDKRRREYDRYNGPKQIEMMDEAIRKYGGVKHQ